MDVYRLSEEFQCINIKSKNGDDSGRASLRAYTELALLR